MTPLLVLLPLPLLIVIMALTFRRTLALAKICAVLSWAQMLTALFYWSPLLTQVPARHHVFHGFSVDTTSGFFVLLTTVVCAISWTQAVSFFTNELESDHAPDGHQISQFYACSALFLIAMYVVVSADNLGFMWIGMEATTLVSAPLVYYYRTGTSLEAAWKYLIVCSVGIALAFFGTALFYSASQSAVSLAGGTLSIERLTLHAAQLPVGLLRLGYMFILLGYGTKAGLFPLHSWLPDAHSEAPAPISAMMSGALLNCALVALWRVGGIMDRAGQNRLVLATLLPLAVLTVVAAALFLLKQNDLKRMLAYSSMENVGLMAIAIAIGTPAGFALQALNHSLVKVALFLLAGLILQQYGTKKIEDIKGMLTAQPAQGMLLFALIVAVAGTPPFGSFLSEWRILSVAADQNHVIAVTATVAALAVGFIALSIHGAGMLFGRHCENQTRILPNRSPLIAALLLALSLCLGLFLTPSLVNAAGRLVR
jgi:hydrogenase-4 component F